MARPGGLKSPCEVPTLTGNDGQSHPIITRCPVRQSFVTRLRLLLGLALTVAAAPAAAQGTAYSLNQLDTPPRLASQEMTARLLARSYPPALKRAGITGSVQLEFVVDSAGRVEPETIRVLDATSEELAAAARSVATDIRFRPGVRQGQRVRAVVSLPIAYQ
jgi:protein TonB